MEPPLPMLGRHRAGRQGGRAAGGRCDALLVLDDGKPVGVLTRQDLLSDIG